VNHIPPPTWAILAVMGYLVPALFLARALGGAIARHLGRGRSVDDWERPGARPFMPEGKGD
jgi:hypothetical protein